MREPPGLTTSGPLSTPSSDPAGKYLKLATSSLGMLAIVNPVGATSFIGDCVLVLMEGGRTPQEELLARCGRFELVVESRSVLLRVVRPEYTAVIERLVGRRVVGFMSDCQADPDLECQVYVLAPADAG